LALPTVGLSPPDERSELHLVNPITRDQIALPSVTTIEQVKPIYDSNGAIHMYKYSRYTGTHGELDPPSVLRLDKLRDYIFHKAFLSSDPSTGNYIVVQEAGMNTGLGCHIILAIQIVLSRLSYCMHC